MVKKKKKMLSRTKINRGEMLVHVMQSTSRVSTFRKAKVVKKAKVLKKLVVVRKEHNQLVA